MWKATKFYLINKDYYKNDYSKFNLKFIILHSFDLEETLSPYVPLHDKFLHNLLSIRLKKELHIPKARMLNMYCSLWVFVRKLSKKHKIRPRFWINNGFSREEWLFYGFTYNYNYNENLRNKFYGRNRGAES